MPAHRLRIRCSLQARSIPLPAHRLRIQCSLQAHSISVQMSRAGSVLSISGMGRWLDKGLSKLMGGPETNPSSGPPAASSSVSGFDPYVAKHRRNTSDQLLASDAPKVRCACSIGPISVYCFCPTSCLRPASCCAGSQPSQLHASCFCLANLSVSECRKLKLCCMPMLMWKGLLT